MGDTKISSPILLTTYFETKLEDRYFTLVCGLLRCSLLIIVCCKGNVILYCFFEKKLTLEVTEIEILSVRAESRTS